MKKGINFSYSLSKIMVYVVLVKSQYKRRSAIIDASLSSVIVYSSLVTILKLIDIMIVRRSIEIGRNLHWKFASREEKL